MLGTCKGMQAIEMGARKSEYRQRRKEKNFGVRCYGDVSPCWILHIPSDGAVGVGCISPSEANGLNVTHFGYTRGKIESTCWLRLMLGCFIDLLLTAFASSQKMSGQ